MDNLDKKLTEFFKKEEKIPEQVLGKMKHSLDKKEIKQEKKKNIRRVLEIAAILVVVCIAVNYTVKASRVIKEMKEFEERKIVYGIGSVQEAVESGYIENIDMEYQYQDGIGIKLNSLLLSDNDLSLSVDFKFKQDIDLSSNYKKLQYSYLIYDENNNIYDYMNNTQEKRNKSNKNYLTNFYKQHKIPYNKRNITTNIISNAGGYGFSTYTKNHIISNIQSISSKGYPKAKTLKIQIFSIEYMDATEMAKPKNIPISDAIWELQIKVPDKFYERNNIEYTAKEEPKGFHLEKAIITDTSMSLIATIEGFDEVVSVKYSDKVSQRINEHLSILDETGKQYFCDSTFGCSADRVTTVFSINKNTATDKLYIKVKMNGIEHNIELIRK